MGLGISLRTMPVTHPEPTDATVKELYATALRCAMPQCDEPLYRTATTGATRTLNSRVAHICARRENGPRWDGEMGPVKNRSRENLVLLCTDHSYEIDDPKLVSDYPAPLLHDWKQAQLDEYDRAVAVAGDCAGLGWQLTDAEAAEIIEVSNRYELNAIVNQIGGSGGSFGGGGGGGGVVGNGVGGPGGGGGAVLQDVDISRLLNRTSDVGGSPQVERSHHRQGTEGKGYIAGFDGAYGGDATVAIDGKVVLSAQGGPGGLAGSGVRATSDRLAASTVLLANFIKIMPHGLATLVDAVWASVTVPDFPHSLAFPTLCVIEAGGAEAGEYTVIYELCAPSGEVRTRTSVGLVVEEPGDVLRVAHAFDFSGTVDVPGIWQIAIRSEIAPLTTLDVIIKRQGQPDPSQSADNSIPSDPQT